MVKNTIQIAGLTLQIHGYQFPKELKDCWDANWLLAKAECRAKGASVRANGAFISTVELAALRSDLSALLEGRSDNAELSCMEPELAIRFERCGHLGGLSVLVDLTADHLAQSHRFEFAVDQSHLPTIVCSLDEVLKTFPIRGIENVP